MEYNERINIQNYSYTERRSSNSFANVIRTVLVGMFFLGVLVLILNCSHQYIRNYRKELNNQNMRNLEEIEKDWHIDFLNQIDSSAEEKDKIETIQDELRIKNEIKKENSFFNSINIENDNVVADSFFSNRTLMIKNSSRINYYKNKNLNREKFQENNSKYFLALKNNLDINNIDDTSKSDNFESNNNRVLYNSDNKSNYISNNYYEYINKFRMPKESNYSLISLKSHKILLNISKIDNRHSNEYKNITTNITSDKNRVISSLAINGSDKYSRFNKSLLSKKFFP